MAKTGFYSFPLTPQSMSRLKSRIKAGVEKEYLQFSTEKDPLCHSTQTWMFARVQWNRLAKNEPPNFADKNIHPELQLRIVEVVRSELQIYAQAVITWMNSNSLGNSTN